MKRAARDYDANQQSAFLQPLFNRLEDGSRILEPILGEDQTAFPAEVAQQARPKDVAFDEISVL